MFALSLLSAFPFIWTHLSNTMVDVNFLQGAQTRARNSNPKLEDILPGDKVAKTITFFIDNSGPADTALRNQLKSKVTLLKNGNLNIAADTALVDTVFMVEVGVWKLALHPTDHNDRYLESNQKLTKNFRFDGQERQVSWTTKLPKGVVYRITARQTKPESAQATIILEGN